VTCFIYLLVIMVLKCNTILKVEHLSVNVTRFFCLELI
jgi:hypothetical protein